MLAASGRAATHGIAFDPGSDRLRPESTPTLAAIGRLLVSHRALALSIEAHTASAGTAAANASLSERRAAAVRTYLVSAYRIAGSRLRSRGWGASRPVASGATAQGRQDNERVELVRLSPR